jgi:hypothetical protein
MHIVRVLNREVGKIGVATEAKCLRSIREITKLQKGVIGVYRVRAIFVTSLLRLASLSVAKVREFDRFP